MRGTSESLHDDRGGATAQFEIQALEHGEKRRHLALASAYGHSYDGIKIER